MYRELAQIPIPDSAHFVPSDANTVLRANYVVRDVDNKWRHLVTKSFTLAQDALSATTAAYAPDVRGVAVSPSGKHHAVLKEYIDRDMHTTRRVEIWSDLRLVASLDVSKAHGPFFTDAIFQSISFSPSETALVYSAEANPDTPDDACDDPFQKHRFKPHFGESYPDTHHPTIVMVRWGPPDPSCKKDKYVTVISLPPSMSDDIVFGQATFATEDSIFATGFEKSSDGRFLGIKWCLNRPSSIWELTTTTDAMSDDDSPGDTYTAIAIEVPGRSCRSPRVLFDHHGSPMRLFWLSNPLGGVHASSTSLHVRDLAGDTLDRVLVDSVSDPVEPDAFPGLYTDFNILPNPFLHDTTTSIVLQTIWGSSSTIVSVDIETGNVTHERPRFGGSPLEAWIVLATDGRSHMVCSSSSLTSPPRLVLLTLDHGKWTRRVLDSPVVSPKLQAALDDLALSVIPIPDRHPTETIVVQSKATVTKNPRPYCITFPHGGPHSVYTTRFLLLATALAIEGYTISLPNFTGTLGFGDKYIHKLVGQIGTLDIADCRAAVEELIRRGISDRERQLVFGGSHGGFITGNLIGQYPDLFKAAAMINPVTSLGEFATSDLPDFPFAEIGLPYPPSTGVTPEVYKRLYDASPVSHVGKVRTPVLLILGDSDLRVPPTQGKGYFHALKARDVPVEMLSFAGEGHDFEGVEAIKVTFESVRDWFKAHSTGSM